MLATRKLSLSPVQPALKLCQPQAVAHVGTVVHPFGPALPQHAVQLVTLLPKLDLFVDKLAAVQKLMTGGA